jgi:flagellar biosynthesis protein FlhG
MTEQYVTRLRCTGLTAFASGKGGVGKTFLALTLAHVLARRGRRVLLVDADLGLANIDVQLGLEPAMPLARAIGAQVDLADLVRPLPGLGVAFIGGGGAGAALAGLSDARLQAAIERLRGLARGFDDTLVDLPSGIERIATSFATAADRLIVVGNNEPTTLTDNYAFIKLTRGAAPPPWFLANDVRDAAEGSVAQATLARACRRFLDLDCRALGSVRRDPRVPEAIRRQMPYLDRSPQSAAARDIETIARRLAAMPFDP